MTVVVVGLSHRTSPVRVLEAVAVADDELRKILDELHRGEAISEALLLSTCNRIEVYADVARFHAGVAEISTVLARHAGLAVTELSEHLYVHFAEAAAEHMFSVASGLDSMVVGESQILGQLRACYALGADTGSVGTVLHDLAQTALRVGKRVHAETGIDRAGASVVSVALDQAALRAVIVGAGSMGALAGATLRRRGVREIVVANRSRARADRLAATLGARSVRLDDVAELAREIADADVLISSTGAAGLVIESDVMGPRERRPLAVLDLALPRDVDPSVGTLPGVTYVDLAALRTGGAGVSEQEIRAATTIVAEELGRYLTAQHQLAAAPTVTALRARANEVVDAELRRLDARLPGLDDAQRREVAEAVRRAVEKVLHTPTVRMKELAALPGGDQYAAALRELFELDPAAVEAVAAIRTVDQ
jgi:glutamyl-tRNA reductase